MDKPPRIFGRAREWAFTPELAAAAAADDRILLVDLARLYS